ncbi:MAG: EI24 domain-containing protein [Alphaproteobacteria bacterium]|nr:EI24 domain-containing protein [Alphaproteobacteria bacterium]
MFASLRKAAYILFDRTFSRVVARALLLTIVLYAILFVAVVYGVHRLPTLGAPWVNAIVDALAPALMLLLPFFLGAPVAAFFASLFLERVAREVEARYYPTDPEPSGAPFGASLFAGLQLAALVVLVDLALLPADVAAPGVAELATLLANGWLLGRQYFELVALRHLSRTAARALRRRHAGGIFLAGVIISILTVVPVADLLAPLFGAAFMVHMYKRYRREEHPA